jgi:hypothetical protein
MSCKCRVWFWNGKLEFGLFSGRWDIFPHHVWGVLSNGCWQLMFPGAKKEERDDDHSSSSRVDFITGFGLYFI